MEYFGSTSRRSTRAAPVEKPKVVHDNAQYLYQTCSEYMNRRATNEIGLISSKFTEMPFTTEVPDLSISPAFISLLCNSFALLLSEFDHSVTLLHQMSE